ncbi:MAG: B12-binding domain-containing radical SAM protein [Spirochaetes bacterium]|nr:B12-binding domain-containing radical SAM protein [Spirochaetota bacterium]
MFSLFFTVSIVAYFTGIFLTVRNLRNEFSNGDIKSERKTGPRLLLINPVNNERTGLTVNTSSAFPPLGLGIIAALTPADFQIEIIDENFDEFQFKEADLVGITAFTSSAPRAYEIAAVYRGKNIPVIMGGIHATMCTEEALKYVDAVVTGEAESVWPKVIKDFSKGSLESIYHGTPADLTEYILPRRDLFSNRYLFSTIQTSRGCPMDCYFCSVSAFNGRKYRQRPVDDILFELETIKNRYMFFIDDNILGYGPGSEQRAIDLFKGMVDRKLNKVWFCQASINFGCNREVLKWAGKSGCKMVFLGLESADPEELETMDKKLNLKTEYDTAFKNINDAGIAVLGAFIYGSDFETAESMRRKTDYILSHSIDVIQSTILTPLPGTRLYKQYADENRILYRSYPEDWTRFDMGDLTYKMKRMNNDEFCMRIKENKSRLYSRFNLLKTFLKTLMHTRKMETALWALSSNKNYRNVAMAEQSQKNSI